MTVSNTYVALHSSALLKNSEDSTITSAFVQLDMDAVELYVDDDELPKVGEVYGLVVTEVKIIQGKPRVRMNLQRRDQWGHAYKEVK